MGSNHHLRFRKPLFYPLNYETFFSFAKLTQNFLILQKNPKFSCMNIEEFRDYCLQKKGVEEAFPFDEATLVFKVMGKMFALTGLNRDGFAINLKCDPIYAIDLRERHEEIQEGYHMSKKHWNTVACEGSLEDKLILELVDHSYDLIVKKLKKADREFLNKLD